MLEALKLDRTPMQGRPVFVSKCEDRSQKKAQFKVRESVFILFAGLGQRVFFFAGLGLFNCENNYRALVEFII